MFTNIAHKATQVSSSAVNTLDFMRSILGGTMNKVYEDAKAAIFDISDGITLMSGGFGLCGNPENLIQALYDRGNKKITVISFTKKN